MKIGRNDLCLCDSGKKYKKCCMDKEMIWPEGVDVSTLSDLLTYERISQFDTDEIIRRLRFLGIPFDRTEFIEEVKEFYSADQLSENWFEKYEVRAPGLEEDFPWLAAWILWERLAPVHIVSLEQMDELIEVGYSHFKENDYVQTCDAWLQFWEALKYRINPAFKNLDYLEEQYEGTFYVHEVCQTLEANLYNAGIQDATYFEKRLTYCQEFIRFFPEEDESIIHNMKRAIAESYASLGESEKAEAAFKGLIEAYPHNPWGLIGWGDWLLDKQHYDKAQELYENASDIAKDKWDISAIDERFDMLSIARNE